MWARDFKWRENQVGYGSSSLLPPLPQIQWSRLTPISIADHLIKCLLPFHHHLQQSTQFFSSIFSSSSSSQLTSWLSQPQTLANMFWELTSQTCKRGRLMSFPSSLTLLSSKTIPLSQPQLCHRLAAVTSPSFSAPFPRQMLVEELAFPPRVDFLSSPLSESSLFPFLSVSSQYLETHSTWTLPPQWPHLSGSPKNYLPDNTQPLLHSP